MPFLPSNQVYFLKQNREVKEIWSPRCARPWSEFWHKSGTVWSCVSLLLEQAIRRCPEPSTLPCSPFTLTHSGCGTVPVTGTREPSAQPESWDSSWATFSPSPPGYPGRSSASPSEQPARVTAMLFWQEELQSTTPAQSQELDLGLSFWTHLELMGDISYNHAALGASCPTHVLIYQLQTQKGNTPF